MNAWKNQAWKTLSTVALSSCLVAMPAQAEEKIRNLILMIGDGMGPQQIGLLESYARKAPHSIYQGKPTAITQIAKDGVTGFSMTNPQGALVVDSACSATQLALGIETGSEVIGIDADGNSVETILEKAKRLGKATGLVSDTRLTHATPAAFAAHQPHRSLENEIAVQMLEVGPDVMLSGGIRHWIPKSTNDKGAVYQALQEQTGGTVKLKSKRKDDRNLLSEAADKGYQLAFNRAQLDQANGKVLGLFAYSGMMDGIQYSQTRDDASRVQPTLKEMTMKALDILAKDEDGFFLMIEGGQIDWAGHNNDAGTMLHEMLKFDETVQYVYEWVQGRDDTMVVITADHETGSFGLSYSAANLPEAEKRSGPAFANRDYKPNFNFGSFELMDKLYAQNASFPKMMAQLHALPKEQQNAANLAKVINENNAFQVTEAQAARILKTTANPFLKKDHKYMSAERLPQVDDFQAFFVYGEEIHHNLIGRALAEQQNVVWGTGTHTHTPVNVIAWGPEQVTKPLSGLMHHAELGSYMMDLVSK
ncbi:alkaline phosphatase [Marinobacterium arenosum]|uniref:alkaline phosphatase n=1 Tax=Marinobacterium arenosum TaxID=2862496 RepID=UPI002105AE30|nr:alkaline phosphatase [Marinobacterium arenosum]